MNCFTKFANFKYQLRLLESLKGDKHICVFEIMPIRKLLISLIRRVRKETDRRSLHYTLGVKAGCFDPDVNLNGQKSPTLSESSSLTNKV